MADLGGPLHPDLDSSGSSGILGHGSRSHERVEPDVRPRPGLHGRDVRSVRRPPRPGPLRPIRRSGRRHRGRRRPGEGAGDRRGDRFADLRTGRPTAVGPHRRHRPQPGHARLRRWQGPSIGGRLAPVGRPGAPLRGRELRGGGVPVRGDVLPGPGDGLPRGSTSAGAGRPVRRRGVGLVRATTTSRGWATRRSARHWGSNRRSSAGWPMRTSTRMRSGATSGRPASEPSTSSR